jgi:murein DD-endopeptidase MepM/ murein hydrolase activator NlpD
MKKITFFIAAAIAMLSFYGLYAYKAKAGVSGYIMYQVKEGDTLYGICRENIIGISEERAVSLIINKNHLKNKYDIKIGQKISIPYKNQDNSIQYLVRRGDTLPSIAQKLMPGQNTDNSIKKIMEENSLTFMSDIEEGQILLIPVCK